MAKPPVKAQQLAEELGERIRSGEWKPGAWLPSERQIGATHGSSRGTVQRALEQLAAEGLVERSGGSSARVLPSMHWRDFGESDDPATVQQQIDAVRAELRRLGERLSAIETRERPAG